MIMNNNTQQRFEHYLNKFIQADTPEERQKVIEEYTEVCFSQMELDQIKGDKK